jgi:hypothetical protein
MLDMSLHEDDIPGFEWLDDARLGKGSRSVQDDVQLILQMRRLQILVLGFIELDLHCSMAKASVEACSTVFDSPTKLV